MKLLIDGDMLVHRSCSAVEKDTRFLDRYHILFSDFEDAMGVLEGTLGELTDIAGTDDVVFAFSTEDRSNWRNELVDPGYKMHRSGGRKPLAYWEVVEEIERRYPVERRPLMEGDDVLGILQTAAEPGTTCIWSLDKDMKQIPGLHLKDDELIEVSVAEGDRFHMIQTLSGDVTDGYPGCPGIGNVRAAQIVDSGMKLWPVEKVITRGPRKGEVDTAWEERPAETVWKTVLSHYRKAGLAPAAALQQARLARILRASDYPNGEIKLWVP